MMIDGKQIYLVGWLIAATVLMSLAGLTAEPFQPHAVVLVQVPA